jgi:PAS domain-containing protein
MADDPRSEPPSESGATSRLELLPLHSTDLLTLLDASGVVRYESPSIERLFGFAQTELVGEEVADYVRTTARTSSTRLRPSSPPRSAGDGRGGDWLDEP